MCMDLPHIILQRKTISQAGDFALSAMRTLVSILGTNVHCNERVCHAERSLTLTYIFKVIRLWLCDETAQIWHFSSCPLCTSYSYLRIISTLDTNVHHNERVCHAQRSLTLIYIFQVIRLQLCNETAQIWHFSSCPLCTSCSSLRIISILGTNVIHNERVCYVQRPLTLTYIFKVIWPRLCNEMIQLWHFSPFCTTYNYPLIPLATNGHYIGEPVSVYR